LPGLIELIRRCRSTERRLLGSRRQALGLWSNVLVRLRHGLFTPKAGIAYYDRGGSPRPGKSPFIMKIGLAEGGEARPGQLPAVTERHFSRSDPLISTWACASPVGAPDDLGRFLWTRREFDDLPAIGSRNPFCPWTKIFRYVELDYLCHDSSPLFPHPPHLCLFL
jgi:hypothetical protein